MDTPIRNRNGQVVGVISHTGGPYKPGDQPPFGHCDWMEWAEVQHKAGLRQRQCVKCDKYRYPQEIARWGRSPVCKECSEG